VQEEPTAEHFHEWRKQVNHLRHQLQLLQTLKPGQVKTTLRACKSLAAILGLKNDLAVLSQHLQRRRRNADAPTHQALELMQQQNAAFAEQSLRLGQHLYERSAKAFTRSLW
jgi:CHAD domain-containing protein